MLCGPLKCLQGPLNHQTYLLNLLKGSNNGTLFHFPQSLVDPRPSLRTPWESMNPRIRTYDLWSGNF